MRDPWTVLGVSQNATEEEIKKAYRALAKKYHPDRYASSPKSVQDEAAEKMREINEAYDFLIKKGGTASEPAGSNYNSSDPYAGGNNSYASWSRQYGWGSNTSGNNTYSSGNNTYSSGNNTYSSGNHYAGGNNYAGSQEQTNFNYIRRMIQENELDAAEQLLGSMSHRPAEWHFLRGLCYLRRGWYTQAKDCLDTAVRMDPNNQEYRSVQQQIRNNVNQYRQRSESASSGIDTCCSICNCILCTDCCCECMGCDCCDCC